MALIGNPDVLTVHIHEITDKYKLKYESMCAEYWEYIDYFDLLFLFKSIKN